MADGFRLPPHAGPLPAKSVQTLERVAEMFGAAPVPSAFAAFGRCPAFLGDFYMNFKKFVWSDGKLPAKRKALLAFVAANLKKSAEWTEWAAGRCRELGWTDAELADAVAVAATCAMYNAFFKFRDLAGTEIFNGMAVGLRAHTFAGTALDGAMVELINIVVSDLNGCKPCTSGHVEKARQEGLSDEALLEAVQCAATLVSGVDASALSS